MMNDTIDDAMAEDGDEAEESEIINKVLEEIGIGMNQEVLPVPSVQKLLAARCVVRRAWEWRSPAAASLRIGLFLRWVATCCPVPALGCNMLPCAALRCARCEFNYALGSARVLAAAYRLLPRSTRGDLKGDAGGGDWRPCLFCS